MATKNAVVSLDDHSIAFAESQVASGRYASAGEVVHAALRLLEDEHGQVERLRVAIREGIDSGPGEPWDVDLFLKEMHTEHVAG